MGDLISEVLSLSAASSASEAASESRKAAAAANERLESGVNPFIIFESRKKEIVEIPGTKFLGLFGGEIKEKISETFEKISVKRTDIGHLGEHKDDYGTTYTIIYLEQRCTLSDDRLRVLGTMESVQQLINNQ